MLIILLNSKIYDLSAAGVILGNAVGIYTIVAIYQPVVNGVGGNLVAIFSSRLSTQLHKFPNTLGTWVSWTPFKWWLYPYETFFGKMSKFKLKF